MRYGCQSMIGKIERIIIKHPADAFISQEYMDTHWKSFNYNGCPDYSKVILEYEAFEKVIKSHVPEVHYLCHRNEVGLDSIYTYDTVKITKNGAILMNMEKVQRKHEPVVMKYFLIEQGIPVLGAITGKGRMEGGDILWLDEQTLAVARGYRTNDTGILQLKALTKDIVNELIVVPLPHANGPRECLHLLSIISMIDIDLAVVYSRYMPVFFRERLIERGIKFIEVDDEE